MAYESLKVGTDNVLIPLVGSSVIDRVYLGSDIVWPTSDAGAAIINQGQYANTGGMTLTQSLNVSSWNIRPGDVLLVMVGQYGLTTMSLSTNLASIPLINSSQSTIKGSAYAVQAQGGETTISTTQGFQAYVGCTVWHLRGVWLPVAADWVWGNTTPADFATTDIAISNGIFTGTNADGLMGTSIGGGSSISTIVATQTPRGLHSSRYCQGSGAFTVAGTHSGVKSLGVFSPYGSIANIRAYITLRGIVTL